MNIAIVEDEAKLADILSDYLKQAGFACKIHGNGSMALEAFQSDMPDLILLDLMLPGTDGMDVCRKLRQYSSVPIIMLTARVEEIDRLLGLELGADDYICKPYSPREVVARVKAVLRRSNPEPEAVDAQVGLLIDEQRACASLDGRIIQLTAVELGLLKAMTDAPGRIYNRNQLMNRIYPDNRVVSDRTIDSHIKKLRQKLEQLDPAREFIQSVYGIGYKFDPVPNEHTPG